MPTLGSAQDKRESDSVVVNEEQGTRLYFQTLLLLFTHGHNSPSWLLSGFRFVKQLYRIVNGNLSIYEVQKKFIFRDVFSTKEALAADSGPVRQPAN